MPNQIASPTASSATSPTISPTVSPTDKVNSGIQVDSHNPFSIIMNNPWLTTGVIGSIGILVLLVVLIKWSNSEGRKQVNQRISEMLADPLAKKLGATRSEVIAFLNGAGNSELKPKLKRLVDSVKITATKTKIGQPVEMSVVLNYRDGTSYSARSGMMWEDLPSEIREALIRSEINTIDCPWTLPSS